MQMSEFPRTKSATCIALSELFAHEDHIWDTLRVQLLKVWIVDVAVSQRIPEKARIRNMIGSLSITVYSTSCRGLLTDANDVLQNTLPDTSATAKESKVFLFSAFCLTWTWNKKSYMRHSMLEKSDILTAAFQKSLASVRWHASHICPAIVYSTTNTCCRMAPPITSPCTVSLTLIRFECGSVHTNPASTNFTRFRPFNLDMHSDSNSFDSNGHVTHSAGSSGIVLLSYVTLTLAATGCENVDCSNGAFNVPNPVDCASFCQCSWGSAIYQPCPPGLHFNANLQVCDWPESAQCNLNNPPPSTPKPPTSTTLPTETTTIRDTSGCEDTHCPYLQIHMNLPHPYDCKSYCMCDYGTAVRVYCPAELHFSAELHVCDWPIRAKCEIPNNDLPTIEFPTTEIPGCETVDCPQNPGIELEPNPSSNSSFCVCFGGRIAIEVPCPQGTKFNSHRRTCDSEGTTTEGNTQTVELTTGPPETSTSPESTIETSFHSETTTTATTMQSTLLPETTVFTTTIPPETTTPEITTFPPTESSTLHLYTTTTIVTPKPTTTTTTKPPRTTTTEEPEICEDSVCKTGVEYARMPKLCWGVCRCVGGRAITFHCPDKKVFNLQRHECEEPEEPCDD
ncbi:hypothetical protein B566_EDAN004530 [Ephemera danica]|nr:hypothetical protein B566_EDAN004530 [Ephemera danica]